MICPERVGGEGREFIGGNGGEFIVWEWGEFVAGNKERGSRTECWVGWKGGVDGVGGRGGGGGVLGGNGLGGGGWGALLGFVGDKRSIKFGNLRHPATKFFLGNNFEKFGSAARR